MAVVPLFSGAAISCSRHDDSAPVGELDIPLLSIADAASVVLVDHLPAGV